MSLEQIGRQIVRASKSLTPEQQNIVSNVVMKRLRVPVGALKATAK
jgi:hypothetical protein